MDGKRAFKYARTGTEVELKPKTLVIDELELVSLEWITPEGMKPEMDDKKERIKYQHENLNDPYLQLVVRVVCSKGTYIRALARDIGQALDSGAYLTGLIRTRIGDYTLKDCLDIEHFDESINAHIAS